MTCKPLFVFQVLHVEQLKLLERHKRPPLDTDEREIIYDKQSELERPQVIG